MKTVKTLSHYDSLHANDLTYVFKNKNMRNHLKLTSGFQISPASLISSFPSTRLRFQLLEPDRATAKNVLVVFFLRNAKSVEYAQTLASELFNLLGVKDHVNVVVPSGRPVYSSMRPLLNNVEYLKQTISESFIVFSGINFSCFRNLFPDSVAIYLGF